MARYNPYNRGMQYPDMQENTQVPYLSYYDPQQVERLGTVIQQRGQRYDASQAAIAKYLEDAGATEMRGPDRDAVIAKISSELDAVKGKVKERYNGDYGLAVNDVIQGLSKSSRIYKQAGQKYKEEQKYLPLYQKLKSEGKLVTPKGALNPFEQSSFDESTGRFKDLDYSQMYERNDYTGWNKENIAKRLNDTITNNTAEVLKNASSTDSPYLLAQKIKGKSQEYIIANKDKIISDGDVKLFMEQNPTFAIEHGNDKEAAKQFMFETTLNQVSQQIDPEVIGNQYWSKPTKVTPRQVGGMGEPILESTGLKPTESYKKAVSYREGMLRPAPRELNADGSYSFNPRKTTINESIEGLNKEKEFYQIQAEVDKKWNPMMTQESARNNPELRELLDKKEALSKDLTKMGISPDFRSENGLSQVNKDIERFNDIKSIMAVTKMNYQDDKASDLGYTNYEVLKHKAASGDGNAVKDLKKLNEASPQNDDAWLDIMDTKRDLTKNRVGNAIPIIDEAINSNLKSILASSPSTLSFYTNKKGESTSLEDAGKYLYGSDGARKLSEYINQKVIKDPAKNIKIDKSTGMYLIDVPTDVTISSKGELQINKDASYTTIRISGPTAQRGITAGLKRAESLAYNTSRTNMTTPETFTMGNQKVEYMFNNAQLEDPSNAPVFTVTNMLDGSKTTMTLDQLKSTALQDHMNILAASIPVK